MVYDVLNSSQLSFNNASLIATFGPGSGGGGGPGQGTG